MPRRILEGKVVSDKTNKTVTVLVERRYMHPIYKKYLKHTTKYAAHDELNAFREGDAVEIQECRPISKTKTWIVITDVPADRQAEVAAKAEAAKAEPKTEKAAPAKKAASAKTAPAAKKPAAKTTAKAKKAE
ncbi:MAG: 30S ribosomal protein S17 [Pseudomonadota bacterium]